MTKNKNSFFVDMHVHTTASDGSYSPCQTVKKAAEIGLYGISITDHDTTDGFEEACKTGEKYNIKILAGVEMSLDFVRNTHLLGYFPHGYSKDFIKEIEHLKRYRKDRIPKIFSKLNSLNCPLTLEEVKKEARGGQIGRPHIAKAMIKKKYVSNVQEAFDKYLASYAPAYVDKKRFSPRKAITLIQECGGISVLAHPFTMALDIGRLKDQIREWKEMGLKGIEVLYSEYTVYQQKIINDIATQNNMIKTGGSDFHGATKPTIALGTGKGNLRIPRKYFDNLYR